MHQVAFDFLTNERAVNAWGIVARMPLLVVGRRDSTLVIRGRESEILAAVDRWEHRYIHHPVLTAGLHASWEQAREQTAHTPRMMRVRG